MEIIKLQELQKLDTIQQQGYTATYWQLVSHYDIVWKKTASKPQAINLSK